MPGRLVTRTRRELISDAAWYRSVAWNEYRRPVRIDVQLTSVYRIPKRVAARLGLSQTTTHQYVTALYRHVGVASRAQLLAQMIKRIGRRGSGGHPAGAAGVQSADP